jgi:hypothetical protein
MTLQSIITELERQLNWEGPGGRVQGHVVMSRHQAEFILEELRKRLTKLERL